MTFEPGDIVKSPEGPAVVLPSDGTEMRDTIWVEIYPDNIKRFYAPHNLVKLVPEREVSFNAHLVKVSETISEYMDKHEKWGKRLYKHTKGTPIINDLAVLIAKKLTKG